jgi:hypothetical protein
LSFGIEAAIEEAGFICKLAGESLRRIPANSYPAKADTLISDA